MQQLWQKWKLLLPKRRSCTSYIKSTSEGIVELQKDPDHLKHLDDVTKEYSSLTLRNLAIAYKEISFEEFNNFMASKMNTDHLNYEVEQTGFTLVAIAAINDALRNGVPQSVNLCRMSSSMCQSYNNNQL